MCLLHVPVMPLKDIEDGRLLPAASSKKVSRYKGNLVLTHY